MLCVDIRNLTYFNSLRNPETHVRFTLPTRTPHQGRFRQLTALKCTSPLKDLVRVHTMSARPPALCLLKAAQPKRRD